MIRRLDHAPVELADIHARCFDHGWSVGVLSDLAAKPLHRLYVLDEDGQPASFILLTVIAGEGEILTLATDPSQQGRGLAHRLLDHVIAELRAESADSLFLEVAVDNTAALRLYEATGFARVGVRKAYYSRPAAAPVDGHILRLALI